jgi:hypothetical protein
MGTEETCENTLEEVEVEIILRGARPRWMASSNCCRNRLAVERPSGFDGGAQVTERAYEFAEQPSQEE